jgi:N-methylhydantoinase B
MATIDRTKTPMSEEEHRAFWDGQTHSYIPAATLRVPDGLELYKDADAEVDPITFEVVRHSLWNANEEHGSIITNLAVSPITLETRDFQTAIITGDGEILFFGPYLQYLAGFMDMVVKYIVEERGADIRPGDMWLVNDPWIGTAHQPDVNLLCPVFVEDKLFCWVANNVHQNDIGGTVPGSFCTNAQDIYYDPVVIPPCRIVKNDQIDRDIEDFYRRQSRTPINLALDLRACVAGNHAARARILGMVERYGASTVKGVMNGLLDASQSSFTELLSTIPDGTWSERCYQEVAVTGDRGAYRIEMHVRKEGDELIFSNDGTEPEVGAINLPFAAQRGTTLAAINVLTLAEHLGVIGGAARQVHYEPVPGTITCPNYGVAVSPAGIFATELSIAMANAVITKMLLCSNSEVVRSKALATTPGQWHIHIHAGTNQRGAYYVGPMLDAIIGATGATATSDGEFANGIWWIPEGRGPNVESYERDWPILYLYRREDVGSGGAGRFRGGNGGRLAYIPHKGEMAVGVYTSEGVPKTPGILGGNPGATGETNLLADSDVRAGFAAGRLPGSFGEMGGTHVQTYGKGLPLMVDDAAVLEWNWGGAAGYGDPLTREPDRVAADVAAGMVTPEDAHREYGVVLSGADVDADATARRRDELRRGRLVAAGVDRELAPMNAQPPTDDLVIGEDIWVDRASGNYRCAHCGEELGSLENGHAKEHAAVHEHPVADIGPRFRDPATFVDDEIVWRQVFCPGCATRLATEVARPGDELLADIRVSP